MRIDGSMWLARSSEKYQRRRLTLPELPEPHELSDFEPCRRAGAEVESLVHRPAKAEMLVHGSILQHDRDER
jgi:hypothetical protein